MTKVALKNRVDLAMLMDISAACGSSVIYDGHRDNKNYQRGMGVCGAKLAQVDHYRGDWYLDYFGTQSA